VRAFDDPASITKQAGPVAPVVPCLKDESSRKLREKPLTGGVYCVVGPADTIDQADRLRESIRRYRV